MPTSLTSPLPHLVVPTSPPARELRAAVYAPHNAKVMPKEAVAADINAPAGDAAGEDGGNGGAREAAVGQPGSGGQSASHVKG